MFATFRKFVFILALLLVASCHAKLKLECLVDYLKFRNVQDDAFDSVEQYSGDPGTCTDDVKLKIDEIYGNARSKMETNFLQKPHADCAMELIENESYENLILKAEAIEMKGVGFKFWNRSSKNLKIEQAQKEAQEIVDSALIKCKGQSDYGAFFDTYYEQKRREPLNDNFDYCMRKQLMDKSYIKLNQYNFKVNPKNIRVDIIDCDEIMKVALEQMKASISNAGSKCVIDSFIDNGYLDLIMKIQLLTKLSLTASEKLQEKQNFVNHMIIMTHKIKSCPLKNN